MEQKRYAILGEYIICPLLVLHQAKLLEEASLIWAMVEMVGLASYYNYFLTKEGKQGVEMVAKPAATKEGVKAGSK